MISIKFNKDDFDKLEDKQQILLARICIYMVHQSEFNLVIDTQPVKSPNELMDWFSVNNYPYYPGYVEQKS